MYDAFETLFRNQPWGMIVIVVLIGAMAGVITGIAKEIRKFACHRREAELKHELVERGLSVEEIERIVRARSTDRVDAGQNV
jgi:hypothetical protein